MMTKATELSRIEQHIEHLDNIIHVLEATANVHYSPDDMMWNILLRKRDELSPFINAEIERLYKQKEKFK